MFLGQRNGVLITDLSLIFQVGDNHWSLFKMSKNEEFPLLQQTDGCSAADTAIFCSRGAVEQGVLVGTLCPSKDTFFSGILKVPLL